MERLTVRIPEGLRPEIEAVIREWSARNFPQTLTLSDVVRICLEDFRTSVTRGPEAAARTLSRYAKKQQEGTRGT